MNRYIQNIKINQIYHLHGIDIPIIDDNHPHLMITGKNGSGKTSVLRAVADFLDKIMDDIKKYTFQYRGWLENAKNSLKENTDPTKALELQVRVKEAEKFVTEQFGMVDLHFSNINELIYKFQEGKFIIAFYQADRKVTINEPENPTKPSIKDKWNVKEMATQEFLNFLSDLKIQEALARNENLYEDADVINQWFQDFEGLLQKVFQDEQLRLMFNYKDYSFKIETEGKSFKFTEMSDGFAAVLDIIVDLILKMQEKESITKLYEQEGIVLIDEIETHLHLELQKMIMPLLTQIFPNIQFIVTTHSPFVLNSLNTAVAFDLEHQKAIENLTEFSYEALAEGYFGVRTVSSYMEMQLGLLKSLLQKESLTEAERIKAKDLIADFDKIPEPASPTVVGQFLQIKIDNIEKIRNILGND